MRDLVTISHHRMLLEGERILVIDSGRCKDVMHDLKRIYKSVDRWKIMSNFKSATKPPCP